MISLATLLADHQLYHSDFQMDSLITARAGGTEYGCYKQSLRELWKRYRGLRDLYAQLELLCIDIEELSTRQCENEFQRRRVAVEMASKHMSRSEIDKNITDTEREFLRFYGQAASLKEAIGALDERRRADLDAELWEYRIKAAAAVDFISSGKLSTSTIELLHAFPINPRKRLIAELLNPLRREELVSWYLSHSPDVPAFVPVRLDNVRRLIEC